MTLLAGGVSLLLALVCMLAGAWEASRAAVRARAQMAADAAALAAAAESTSIGRGLHRYEARRFARANGGEVLSCLCYPGATAVQVEVEVEGTTAIARAEFDADLSMPSTRATAGLDPVLARSVDLLVARSGGAVWVASGYRSQEEQRGLWERALARYGSTAAARRWVAPPGTSMHQRGLAVDLGGDLDLAAALVRSLGLPLHRPLDHEPWHLELVGSRANPV